MQQRKCNYKCPKRNWKILITKQRFPGRRRQEGLGIWVLLQMDYVAQLSLPAPSPTVTVQSWEKVHPRRAGNSRCGSAVKTSREHSLRPGTTCRGQMHGSSAGRSPRGSLQQRLPSIHTPPHMEGTGWDSPLRADVLFYRAWHTAKKIPVKRKKRRQVRVWPAANFSGFKDGSFSRERV